MNDDTSSHMLLTVSLLKLSHIDRSVSADNITSVSETILIEDDNIIKTTLSCSQASSVTFSPSSAENVMRTSGSSDPAVPALFFNFSMCTRVHFYIGIPANLAINDINVVHRVIEESEACTVLLQEWLATLEFLADLEF
ncbi:hypothetical protein BDDG_07393 [Blastomyces dermatitidis ATCC 18188]|uniref:Uncharacterized protein n=1 Tax=Ajellomyces dermatitidis (strain ATCC 18188 / CBS 674.68) TaxID=653446 RepID=F2TMI5_AJEDA|nr:hypothetical protein BDDG_07393 [Blastomyces dermatitidis ATCC 18188]